MRRRVLWMLVALTAALLWAGGVACTGDSIESEAQEEQRLRDEAAAQTQPFTLELENSRELCTAGTTTGISWTISGGTAPYTLNVEGSAVDVSADNVQINCSALTEAETADEDAALAAKTVTAVVTDSRGIRREATLNIARTRILAPILSAATAASGSVALSWSGGPAILTRWEYRQRAAGGSWGAWTTIAGDASTAEHTVSDLAEDVRYDFQLRVVETTVTGPASETASAVAGLTPPPPLSLSYRNYDASGGATAPGAFSLLTNAADLSSGVTNYSEAPTASALLVNIIGYSGSSDADRLGTVAVGDTLTWEEGCWFAYRVTAVLNDPPPPARKLFAVALTGQGHSCAGLIDTGDWTSIVRGPPPSEPGIGADGIRILPYGYPVEGGRTYRLAEYGRPGRIVIDVPAGMRLIDRGVSYNGGYWAARLKDEASGAVLVLSFRTGRELRRYFPTEYDASSETRDVGALFDAIIASARVQPER